MSADEKTEDEMGTETGQTGQDEKPKIDWSQVDPEQIPHEVASQTPAFKGTLRELQEQRDDNRELADAKAALEAAVDQQETAAATKAEDADPDEMMTRREVDALLAKREEARKKEEADKERARRVEQENESFARLRENYPTEKVAKGMDANTVLAEGSRWLAKNRPALYAAARASRDSAQELYDLSVALVPDIKKRASAAQNASFLDTLKTGGIPKGSGGKPVGQTEASEISKLLDTSEDDLLAQIEKEELE